MIHVELWLSKLSLDNEIRTLGGTVAPGAVGGQAHVNTF